MKNCYLKGFGKSCSEMSKEHSPSAAILGKLNDGLNKKQIITNVNDIQTVAHLI